MPVECLLPIPIVSCSLKGQETISQLQLLLMDTKRAFLDDRATTAIVTSIRTSLHQNPSDKMPSETDCFHINNMLILLRNILHMPDRVDYNVYGASVQNYAEWQTLQNKLVWNLFAQGLDVALLLMINNKNKLIWTLTLVQLIALLFKDQNVAKIQKILTMVSESSDSSDDDIESDVSKNSGQLSRSGSSCESSKGPASNSTIPSDSGYPRHLEDWSSSSSPSSSKTSSFDFHLSKRDCDKGRKHFISNSDILQGNQMDIDRSTLISDSCHNNGNVDKPIKKYKAINTSSVYNQSDNICEKVTVKTEISVTSDFEGSMENISFSDELSMSSHKDLKNHDSDASKQKQLFRLSKTKTESDSSNDDDDLKLKIRSHPPVGWKVKGEDDCKYQHCSSSVCLNAALQISARKGHTSTSMEAILEKRRKVCMVADNLAHNPSDEDISNLLRDFTLSFLHNGFCELVLDLKTVISSYNPTIFDKSHFLWLLTYFLRLSSTHSLAYHHISCILSPDMISYLTFEGILMCEELELFFHTQQMDVQPLIRRMHLLVTAFRELFNTIDSYCKKPVGKREKNTFQKLRVKIADMTDVRQLFLLLIRKYNPQVHSKQYLIDIITTNHVLLLLLEKVYMDPETYEQLDLPRHIQQFGTMKVMEQYGKVLEDYKVNSEYVNDCVFTMMHHVAGEAQSVCSLLNPDILRSFCKILEDDVETKEVWEDLMNYVLHEFMRVAQQCPEACMQKLFAKMTVDSEEGSSDSKTSQNRSSLGISLCDLDRNGSDLGSIQKVNQKYDLLYWRYLQYEHHSDPIGKIQECLQENHINHSRKQILEALVSQAILGKSEYEALRNKEATRMDDIPARKQATGDLSETDPLLDVVRDIILAGNKMYIEWLQRSLLEACYVKSELRKTEDDAVEDPVPFCSHATMQSIPLVPYNESQEAALHSEGFNNLLHMLGFHLPTDVGKVYPRIPSFWTADVIFSIVQRLGPVSQVSGLKFKLCALEEKLKTMHHSCEDSMEDGSLYSVSHPNDNTPPFFFQKINHHSEQDLHKLFLSSPGNHNSELKSFPSNSPSSSGTSNFTTSQGNNRCPPTSFPVMNWMALANKSKTLPCRTT